MDQQALRDLLEEYYGLRVEEVRMDLAKKELRYLYGLRPIYQSQLDVGRKRRDKVGSGLEGMVYHLLGNEGKVQKERDKLYDSTKERYQGFSSKISELEFKYQALHANMVSRKRRLRAIEKILLAADQDMFAQEKENFQQNFFHSAKQAGESLSTHLYTVYGVKKIQKKIGELSQKISKGKWEYQTKLSFDDNSVDFLILLFIEELTFLNVLFDEAFDLSPLLRHKDPILRRAKLSMNKKDMEEMSQEMHQLHKITQKIIQQINKKIRM